MLGTVPAVLAVLRPSMHCDQVACSARLHLGTSVLHVLLLALCVLANATGNSILIRYWLAVCVRSGMNWRSLGVISVSGMEVKSKDYYLGQVFLGQLSAELAAALNTRSHCGLCTTTLFRVTSAVSAGQWSLAVAGPVDC